MRVLLVFPDIISSPTHSGYIHFGLASLSAFLKERRQDHVKLYHVTKRPTEQEFIRNLEVLAPDIVAFTATTHGFFFVKEWTRWIKRHRKDLFVGCGGVHVTLCPEASLSDSELDFIVVGEGEFVFAEAIESLEKRRELPRTEGLWLKEDGRIVHRGKPRNLITDLDQLPFFDWELFNFEALGATKLGIGTIMLSRGCPYDCSYCCNHALRKLLRGKKYCRFKSVPRAIAEIRALVEKYPAIHTIAFEDDILPLSMNWFREFCHQYKRHVGYPYLCNIRPNLVSDEVVRLLVESNCIRVGIGIESGNERIRNDVLGRGLSDETMRSAMVLLKKNGFWMYTFNMVGIPGEGKKELLDTVRMNADSGADECQVTVFYPYPGTRLRDYCNEQRLLNERVELTDYLSGSILKMPALQQERVLFVQRYMTVITRVYRRLPKVIAEFFLEFMFSDFCTFSVLAILNRATRWGLQHRVVKGVMAKFWRRFLGSPVQ